MTSLALFVGLDYSDKAIQVCVLDRAGRQIANRLCDNDWRAIAEFVHQHGTVVEAAIESCTGAANLAEELATQAGWSVHLAHPGYVARMKQTPDKTDFQDARLLADLVRVGYLPKVWLAPQCVRDVRRLVRYRQQLANQRRSQKLRIRAILREERCRMPGESRAWTKAWLAWLKHQAPLTVQSRWVLDHHVVELQRLQEKIREVEKHLEEVTADDPVVAKLQEQSGIGPITSWVLRAEVGRFDRFRSGKQLARFAGVSPRNASSGARQADAGLIKASNPILRAVLMETAHRLQRRDVRWAQLASRLRSAGKKGSVVAAAVANRWIRWLYHQMKTAA